MQYLNVKRGDGSVYPVSAEDLSKLLAMPLSELRQVAMKEYKIVGASKIPGGKVGLIEAIHKQGMRASE